MKNAVRNETKRELIITIMCIRRDEIRVLQDFLPFLFYVFSNSIDAIRNSNDFEWKKSFTSASEKLFINGVLEII